ncbi:MAG: RNHCP domain-containing protein [Pseudomonadota bacterium]
MALQTKRFQVVNEGFVCEHCGKDVPPTAKTAPRNHCPFCLWCKHVDINPGDRANTCQGMMRPIGIYTHTQKEYVILHQCERCGQRVKAKAILKDKNTADSFDMIMELSGKPIHEKRPLPPYLARKARHARKARKA